jgi:hypothetical protein
MNNEGITRVWQKWRFRAPQTHLWLIKVWFSASTFLVQIATFAKPENVVRHYKEKHRNNEKDKIRNINVDLSNIIVWTD